MMYKRYWLCCVFLLFTCFVLGQGSGSLSTKSKKAARYFNEAEELLRLRKMGQALDLLLLAVEKDPSFAEPNYYLGAIYRRIGENDKALVYYRRLHDSGVEFNPAGTNFSLGQLYHLAGTYDSAQYFYNRYLESGPKDISRQDEVKLAMTKIAYALEGIKQPLSFEPYALPDAVNTLPQQYFPVLTVDGRQLIFTGRKGFAANYDEDLYICTLDANGNWSAPKSISDDINSRANEGTCTISADGRTLIFTSCAGRDGYGSCDLYIATKRGEVWGRPQNMGLAINTPYWESQPSLSADGRTLYFVSDRPGGVGRRDIWVSRKNDKGIWGKPANLGTAVNTGSDEVSPFIHVNGQSLYFSSNGFAGFGGYDLFLSQQLDSGWSEPKNLGYPLNTNNDEVSLFITADGSKGYYAFEKRQGPERLRVSNIYAFDVPAEIQVTNKSTYVVGKVYDAETKKVLEAGLVLYDLASQQLISSVNSDAINGKYFMVLTQGGDYALYVNSPGYLFQSLHFDTHEASLAEPVTIDFYLQPVKAGATVVLNNLFFDVNKYTLKKKSQLELDKVIAFMMSDPDRKIEIQGHTDDTGSDDYNMSLSLNRAKAVYEYLVAGGVDLRRLRYKGFGKLQPVAPNTTAEGRQKNRRIELKVY